MKSGGSETGDTGFGHARHPLSRLHWVMYTGLDKLSKSDPYNVKNRRKKCVLWVKGETRLSFSQLAGRPVGDGPGR